MDLKQKRELLDALSKRLKNAIDAINLHHRNMEHDNAEDTARAELAARNARQKALDYCLSLQRRNRRARSILAAKKIAAQRGLARNPRK